jgi:hypothetical protein
MRVIQSPETVAVRPDERSVFLAGSIDMGTAIDWQQQLIDALANAPGVVLNPRRAHWVPSGPAFDEQVEWELSAMEAAGLIAFYFAPSSQAPVTLLELGLAARTGKAVVCCPPGYWRKGNVDAVCRRHGIPMVPTLEALGVEVRRHAGGPT